MNVEHAIRAVKTALSCRTVYKRAYPTHFRETGNSLCVWHPDSATNSLHIEAGHFHCHGCGKHGDIIDLTREIEGCDFNAALEICARDAGIEYSKNGKRPQSRVFLCLTALAEYYHARLLENSEALAAFQEQYGSSLEMVTKFRIGFADGSPWDHLSGLGFSDDEIASTGAFRKVGGGYAQFFRGRWTFPYFRAGDVVYMAGRKTRWTEDNDYERAKYKKLPIHGEKWPFVSPEIQNGRFYNEDVISRATEQLIICEGFTDVIAATQHGYAAICPGTARIKPADLERIIPKLKLIKTILVIGDNEVHRAGEEAAIENVKILRQHGVNAHVVKLPLTTKQAEIRDFIRDVFGIHDGLTSPEIKAAISKIPAGDRASFEELSGESKQDVNSYFLDHDADDFQALMASFVPRPELARNTIISFIDLVQMDLPEPRWAIPDLLPEGLAIFAGPPRIGKTWCVMDISLAVASGTKALGAFPCEQGAVLHLSLEDGPRRFRQRLIQMLSGRTPPMDAQFTGDCPRLNAARDKEPDTVDYIGKWLEAHHRTAKLIVVDNLVRIRPRKGSNQSLYDKEYQEIEPLQSLASQYGVALVIVHHLNKGEHRDEFNRITGSTGLTGVADTIWILEKPDRTQTDATLFISGRDLEDKKGALKFHRITGRWEWIGDAAEMAKTNERREIRDVFLSLKRPLKIEDVAGALGCEYTVIKQRLYRMERDGEIVRPTRGMYELAPEDARYGSFHEKEEVRLDCL